MRNKKKNGSWLPSDRLRIKGYSRLLASELYGHNTIQVPRVCDIFNKLNKQTGISANGIRKWVNGDAFPNETNTKLIKKIAPNTVEILKPSIDSTPISRFLCALDVWGSRLDSPVRSQYKSASIFSAGACLDEIAKHWAPHELKLENGTYGYLIPKLKTSPTEQTGYLQYRAYDSFSILDFMFKSGECIDFSDENFEDWAIDMASAALVIKASIDGMPSSKQLLSGDIRDLSNFIYAVFFSTSSLFYEKRLSQYLARKYPELSGGIHNNYAECLISARNILENKLLTFGCDLSIACELFKKIPDKHLAIQKNDMNENVICPLILNDLAEDNQKLKRKSKTDFIYTFKTVNEQRVVTYKDVLSNTETVLPLRNDLLDDYPESVYTWGYAGTGAELLATSIIAHHLGHDEFGSKKAIRLVKEHLAKFLEPHHLRTHLLTTELINHCVHSH